MPGLLSNPQGRGCHSLIKQGAMLVDEPADILKDFGVVPKPAQSNAAGDLSPTKTPWQHSQKEGGKSHDLATGLPHDLAPLQRHLLQRLRTEDCLVDSLLDANVADFHTLNHALLDLEVRGLVACRGGRYTIA
jgi:DNA processing protein